MLTFYNPFIRGKLNYSSIVYDAASHRKKDVRYVQNMAMENIIGSRKSTSKKAMEVALGLITIKLRRTQLT